MACLTGGDGDTQNAPMVIDVDGKVAYWTDDIHTTFTAFAVTTNNLTAIARGMHRGAVLVNLYPVQI